MKKTDYIFHQLGMQGGTDETTKLTVVVTVATGECELVLSKEVSERYPIQKLEEVQQLYERLTGGNGRRVYKPSDLL